MDEGVDVCIVVCGQAVKLSDGHESLTKPISMHTTTVLAFITLLINVGFLCCNPRSRPDVFPGPIRGFNYSKKQDIKIQQQRPGNKGHGKQW